MRNVIIPKETDPSSINLSDVDYKEHRIIAFAGNIPIGFVIHEEGDWRLQETSDYNENFTWYSSLKELVNALSEQYSKFNLKIL